MGESRGNDTTLSSCIRCIWAWHPMKFLYNEEK